MTTAIQNIIKALPPTADAVAFRQKHLPDFISLDEIIVQNDLMALLDAARKARKRIMKADISDDECQREFADCDALIKWCQKISHVDYDIVRVRAAVRIALTCGTPVALIHEAVDQAKDHM